MSFAHSFLSFLTVFGILIVVHELGHFMVAKLVGVRVERFSIGFGPRLFKKKKGATEYSLSLIPLGGFVKLAGDNLAECKGASDEYYSKTPFERGLIIFFGSFLNYVLGFLFFWIILVVGYPALGTKVGKLLPGYGAEAAGLKPGDQITSINGVPVKTFEELQILIYDQDDSRSGNVKLMVARGALAQEFSVNLKQKEVSDFLGQKRTVRMLGIEPDLDYTVTARYNPFESVVFSAQRTWDITILTYKALWRMMTGKMSLRDSVAGPVRIFDMQSKAARLGIVPFLNFMGVLSVSLGIFNLLPFPVLDGGHIFLLILEKIRGKAISEKTDKILTQVGITLLLTLTVLVTLNDVVTMFGAKILAFVKMVWVFGAKIFAGPR